VNNDTAQVGPKDQCQDKLQVDFLPGPAKFNLIAKKTRLQ